MKERFYYLLFLFGLLYSSCGGSGTISYAPSANASIECIQMMSDGSCLVQVSETGGSISSATDAALRAAVYKLIFNGIQGSSKNRIQPVQPLVANESIQNEKNDYFKSFFKDGLYRNYAETMAGSVPSVRRTSSGYKVTVSIILKKELLRKKLEKDNIIKSLSNVI